MKMTCWLSMCVCAMYLLGALSLSSVPNQSVESTMTKYDNRTYAKIGSMSFSGRDPICSNANNGTPACVDSGGLLNHLSSVGFAGWTRLDQNRVTRDANASSTGNGWSWTSQDCHGLLSWGDADPISNDGKYGGAINDCTCETCLYSCICELSRTNTADISYWDGKAQSSENYNMTLMWILFGRSCLRSITEGPEGCFCEPSPMDVLSEYFTRDNSRGSEAGVLPMKSSISDASGEVGAVAIVSCSSSSLGDFKNLGMARQLLVLTPFIRIQ